MAEADTDARVWTTPLGSPVVPLVATTKASPGSVGTPPRSVGTPSVETTMDGRRVSSRRSTAGAGRRVSTGSTASPESHAARRASTKPGPAGRSSATSSPMRVA